MKELGIDISGHRSKAVEEFEGQSFDYVVTVCDNARDNCPIFPAGTARIHWSWRTRQRSRAANRGALPLFGASGMNFTTR